MKVKLPAGPVAPDLVTKLGTTAPPWLRAETDRELREQDL
jgi:hypothetical protein